MLVVVFIASTVYAEDPCNTNVAGKSETQLRADLALCEAEIAKNRAVLNTTNGEVKTIGSEVTALQNKIKAAEATIKSKNSAIANLGSDIKGQTKKIGELEDTIDRGHMSLASLLRKTNEVNDYSLIEVFLQKKNLSEFYIDVDDYVNVKKQLAEHFEYIRSVKSEAESAREDLTEKQNAELDAKYVVEQQKKKVAVSEAEQKKLLGVKKGEAAVYSKIVAEREAKAAGIRAELFKLRDITAIQFADAMQYAKAAEAKTGVRAAFILAILRQESNLGQNVGQCLLVNTETGAGKGKNTGTPFAKVMSPSRDVPPFLALMKAAGRDPFSTPVSCPQSIGWGGAMGPTQFIPSTWAGVSASVAAALGGAAPDPWNPQHAIMATGVFTKQLGAAAQTYSAEREAAGRYYAGGNWQTYGLGYAASVLRYAEEYQKNIDFLDGN